MLVIVINATIPSEKLYLKEKDKFQQLLYMHTFCP